MRVTNTLAALFSFLDFLTLEDGTNSLTRNTQRCIVSQKSADLISGTFTSLQSDC